MSKPVQPAVTSLRLPGILLALCLGLLPAEPWGQDSTAKATPAPASPASFQAVGASLARVSADPQFVEITHWPGLVIDLRYAGDDNFVGRNLYGPFNRAFLHRVAADMLRTTMGLLADRKPGHRLLIFDALRPRSVQWILWNMVVGTPAQGYVANPVRGSVHNFGFALDLSIVDASGAQLDMGTPFDAFTPLAQPRQENLNLKAGRLTKAQLRNRLLLRQVMEAAGFRQLPTEWWHYNALPIKTLRKHYKPVE